MMKKTQRVLRQLRDHESRNVTFSEADGSWPIVWERARGVHIWDAEGKKYLDLTAAFGVANAGHANPRVVRTGQRQMAKLLHAMGDVHPHAQKALLARELSRLTFERWSGGKSAGKIIFNNSGFESVEAALKTARLATGRSGVIGFKGAYHGLGYGTLNLTHREHFRSAFRDQLGGFGHFATFPRTMSTCRNLNWNFAVFSKNIPSAPFSLNPFKPVAASIFHPPIFCRYSEDSAMSTTRCSSWMRFTPASAARGRGSPASIHA